VRVSTELALSELHGVLAVMRAALWRGPRALPGCELGIAAFWAGQSRALR